MSLLFSGRLWVSKDKGLAIIQ